MDSTTSIEVARDELLEDFIKPADELRVDCTDAGNAAGCAAASPVTSCSSSDDDVGATFVCDVCMDACGVDELVHKVCGAACPATMCRDCMHTYISTRVESAIPGVLAKMPCPICLVPVNLVRWRKRLTPYIADFEPIFEAFCSKIERSCEVKCPSCHNNRGQLPLQASSMPPIKMLPSVAARLPDLRRQTRAFCHYELSATDLIAFVQGTFGAPLDMVLLQHLVPLVHDTERRAALYMRLRRMNPFIRTNCCNAAMCFACHVSGHHEDTTCEARGDALAKDQIAECSNCGLQLVKGDGCDWVQCYCGTQFGWLQAVLATKMRQLEPRHLAALRNMIQPFRRYVFKRRLFRAVLSKVSAMVLAARKKGIETTLRRETGLARVLKVQVARWAQIVRKRRVFLDMVDPAATISAKYFWIHYWETNGDEKVELDDEAASFMDIGFDV
ncbi:Aste57867_12588 [Aphanomyces stellatus]|uniref:Aste57867_12588 protein n=1 Tax=Aphanomyces stellatus TaxID=120398 RepID=A0A485KXZ3_9STRA|nr:hypothetical protein As57867_012542 [Aphanomyces stellatus]VFT89439.1 Aste57867_12588 [Aphanomyces stellatus]